MLDYIRRQNMAIKIVLSLVVLSFILFYAGSFSGQGNDPSRYMASVGSQHINMVEFQNMVQTLEQQQAAYFQGREAPPQMRTFIRQQAIHSLVDRKLMLMEAKLAGITASEEETRRNLMQSPYFTESGVFVGMDEYARRVDILFHMDIPSFEKMIAEDVIVGKFDGVLTSGILVSDQEIEDQYRRNNLTAKIDYVAFDREQASSEVEITPEQARAYYDSHKQEFATGETRKVQYLSISHTSEKNRVQIPENKLREHYEANKAKYSRQEQVRARHILLKTEGKNEPDVLKQAEEIVKQLRAAGNFAEMARKYSEDPGSKENGGDLGFFERGRMVPEFEQVAFSQEINRISDPVKSQFGYHIIQVTEKRPAFQMEYALVKDQIYRELSLPQAIKNAQEQAKRIHDDVTKNKKSFSEISKIQLVELKNTDFFGRNEDLPGLSPSFRETAFALKKGEISEPVQVFQDFAILQLAEAKSSEIPSFEKVQAKATQKARQEKLDEVIKQKAQQFYSSIAPGTELKEAAEKSKLEVKTSEPFTKDGYLGNLGSSPEIGAKAFELKAGDVAGPMKTEQGFIVFQLKEKKDFNPADFNREKEQIRQQIFSERENTFFQAYRSMLREKYKEDIWINNEAITGEAAAG